MKLCIFLIFLFDLFTIIDIFKYRIRGLIYINRYEPFPGIVELEEKNSITESEFIFHVTDAAHSVILCINCDVTYFLRILKNIIYNNDLSVILHIAGFDKQF